MAKNKGNRIGRVRGSGGKFVKKPSSGRRKK